MKILRNIYLIFIVLTFTQCKFGNNTNIDPNDLSKIENHFFILDFENSDINMDDLTNQFFTTFPHDDPTNGDVVYDRTKWVNEDMIQLVDKDGLYLYTKYRPGGKKYDSFRLTSKSYYNLKNDDQKLLFVFKGELPSDKGVWPAWWLNGSKQDEWLYKGLDKVQSDSGLAKYSGKGHFWNTVSAVNSTDWPAAGEIDIIEMINGDNLIHNTIHACPQMFDSKWNNGNDTINCGNASVVDPNQGCSGTPYEIDSPSGTFALLWQKDNLKFFYWPQTEDVRYEGGPLSKNPNPELWENKNLKNTVDLFKSKTKCDEDLYKDWQCENCDSSENQTFTNMKMIFNTTLCGKWAGNLFDNSKTPVENCRDFILNEGRDLIDEQFMKIEYISVVKL